MATNDKTIVINARSKEKNMDTVYTIGFTKKTAKVFFELLKNNKVNAVVDIRLNNTSQLAGFSKYPDIEYFLKELCEIDYISDLSFATTEKILKEYKEKHITWYDYVLQFNELMGVRNIKEYIQSKYGNCQYNSICLLCSEEKPVNCHRSLVANYFREVLGCKVINL